MTDTMSVVLLGVVAVVFFAARRGALAVAGPVLALRKFEVNASGPHAVLIEGRPSGLIGWLLSSVGLDTDTRLLVTDKQILFRAASLSGELNHVIPLASVSSVHCGYSQPIWLLVLGGGNLLLALIGSLMAEEVVPLFGGVLFAGACAAFFMLQRKIAITLETAGGLMLGLSFKPSVIEHVTVNQQKAVQALARINEVLAARTPTPAS